MTEPLSPSLPAWVHKRDGRVVPFEADRISRALFAASESLGRPNAFLARELTDAVLHFLPSELDGPTLATAQLAELVAKVVRELGHPALAQAYLEHRRLAAPVRTPATAGVTVAFAPDAPLATRLETCTREYALHAIFARDLQAAHREGLVTLTGLSHPLELAASVLAPAAPGALVEAIEDARRYTGETVSLDGPEYGLARADRPDSAALARELGIGLRATGLRAILNVNCAMPPSWADDLAEGPLFSGLRQPVEPDRLLLQADELTERVLGAGCNVRVDWHLGERDFEPAAASRLHSLVRRAVEGAPLSFVFDRPRRSVALAEGLDRRNVAVLLTVGLDLRRLAEEVGQGGGGERYLQKLGSLARLALSAGTQKREFLRRHSPGGPQLTRGFLLGRARLILTPLGLAETVRQLTGQGLNEGGSALDFARRILQELRTVLDRDGRACQLATGVEVPASIPLDGPVVPAKAQLRTAGTLHAATEQGTVTLLLAHGPAPGTEPVAGWLRMAWQQSEIVRLRLVRSTPEAQQLTLGGSAS